MSDGAQETRPKVGRPSDFTQETADRICAQLAEGKSLRTICKADDMPSCVTVYAWLRLHDEFLKQYTRAKEDSADALAEEMLDIADDGTNDWYDQQITEGVVLKKPDTEHINRSRLRVDTRKWIASKLKPKKYGDKVAVGGAEDLPPIQTADMTPVETARRIAFILQQGVTAEKKA